MTLHREYPGLTFRPQWKLNDRCLIAMGQCISLIKSINHTPIMPKYYQDLMTVAMKKGAQSTTAIEGNTLTDEEIDKLMEGKTLPESLEYQGREVDNILSAFTELFREMTNDSKTQLITPQLLLRFHKMVGKDLDDHFAAIPGQFRNNDVTVGKYRCPDHRDVPLLVDKYCEFLRTVFKYEEGKQQFTDIFIEAIVAHIYLEWIHPFGDGNGRTGRLVEFYILARGCNPNLTLHILSNHYNATRPEYYRQIDKAYQNQDLSEFIEYALIGFRDGLQKTLETVQDSQVLMTWHRYIYDKFEKEEIKQREVFKRKRRFALELPVDKEFTIDEVSSLNVVLAKLYSNVSTRTILRDAEELVKMDILKKKGNKYSSMIDVLKHMMALSMSPKLKAS